MPEPTIRTHADELARMKAQSGPSLEQKIAAMETAVGALMHKVEGVVSRKDSADRRSDDDDRFKAMADAISALTKEVRNLKRDRHDRHEDDDAEVPPEQAEEECEGRETEPEPMSADDNRLGRDDDRRDRRDDRVRRADAQQRDETARDIAQQEFDKAFLIVTGERAPMPIVGQTARTYKTMCLKRLQKFSDNYAKIDLTKLPADAFALADKQIRADAIRVGSDPREMDRFVPSGGLLREIIKTDRTGRKISEFVGPVDAPNGMFAPFSMPPRRVKGFDQDIISRAKRGF